MKKTKVNKKKFNIYLFIDELKNLHQTLQEIRNLNNNNNNENELFYKSDSPKKLDKTIVINFK